MPDERTLPTLPRGATWHALWLLPLLVVVAVVLVPWSEEPSPVFDQAKMKVAAARWQAAVARREAASAAASGSAGAVQVRVIPATPPASGKR